MKTIQAVYENGVFRPLEQVDLPEHALVLVEATFADDESDQDADEIDEILSRRHRSGHHDTAERHNEHQP